MTLRDIMEKVWVDATMRHATYVVSSEIEEQLVKMAKESFAKYYEFNKYQYVDSLKGYEGLILMATIEELADKSDTLVREFADFMERAKDVQKTAHFGLSLT